MVLQFVTAIVLLLILIVIGTLYLQYRRHRKPLLAIDPNVHYSFTHHIKMVTIPTLRYRLQETMPKKKAKVVQQPTITPDQPNGGTADSPQ